MATCFWKTWPELAGWETQRGWFRNRSFLGNHSLQKGGGCIFRSGPFPSSREQEQPGSLREGWATLLLRRTLAALQSGQGQVPPPSLANPHEPRWPGSSVTAMPTGGGNAGGEVPLYSSRKGNRHLQSTGTIQGNSNNNT